uniref:hypothetical protein n=2 Tax=Catenulispora pinisilvae TaxID=2705253 RepID=UPI001892428A
GVHGSGDGDWSLGSDSGNVSAQAYENDAPTYADREREVVEQLPGVLGALLPAGVTVQNAAGPGYVTDALTGDYVPQLQLQWHGTDYVLELDPSGKNTTDVLDKASVKPIAVADGSIRIALSRGTDWYEFAPSDPAAPKIYFMIYSGYEKNMPTLMDATAFTKMVEAPGFAKFRQLLDPSVPASSAAVRERYAIEAKIDAEADKVLPPGFRLKLNPGAPGKLELVGPKGVNSFEWYDTFNDQAATNGTFDSLRFEAAGGNGTNVQVRPDGKARLGNYVYGTGTASDPLTNLAVAGTPRPSESLGLGELGKPVETAPQGPGLTPQQAMAIVKAPGLAKVIADVQKLVALP